MGLLHEESLLNIMIMRWIKEMDKGDKSNIGSPTTHAFVCFVCRVYSWLREGGCMPGIASIYELCLLYFIEDSKGFIDGCLHENIGILALNVKYMGEESHFIG